MNADDARTRILERLRAAAPDAANAADGHAAAPTLSRRIDAHFDVRRAMHAPADAATLTDAMQVNLQAAHAEVWRTDEAGWPALLAGRLAADGVRRLLFDSQGPEGAALSRALPSTVEAVAYQRPIEDWKRELFDTIDAGFTVARSGIAGTGTLVLVPDARSPRTVSLVPPLHVALVYADTLHADLHAAMRAERWQDGMPTNLVLVSGPSKTSDIQQTLAYGAHGPRRLWVLIVERAGKAPSAAVSGAVSGAVSSALSAAVSATPSSAVPGAVPAQGESA
ncbi:lactate utilization protein C [Cupriavidus gilardii]|nr:lactate utilization protein C [Cupriavidus gilardii]